MDKAQALAWYVVITIIGLMGVVRFLGLDASPPGFFMDEAYIGAHVLCLAHNGRDADARAWPLFSPSGGGGFASPTHLYPAALWVRCFGGSIVALRAYAAATMSIALLGLFFLARRLIGDRGGVYALLAASISPFFFQFSRAAFDDPPAFLLGLTWGMYFFLRSPKWLDTALSAVFLSLATYAYPSGRIILPLLVGLLLWMKWKRQELRPLPVLMFFTIVAALCVPLAIQAFSGGMMARYDAVGLFAPAYRKANHLEGPRVWLRFLWNYLLHFSPDYLFLHGDANLRHNSGFSGELSWFDAAALIVGTIFFVGALTSSRKNLRPSAIAIFCITGFVLGVLPAALTWEGIPHSLRSAACWPFAALFTGWIVATVERRWRWTAIALPAVAVAFACGFLHHYFTNYPDEADPYFQALVLEAAEYAQGTGDWDKFRMAAIAEGYDEHACRYFLMEYGGEDCQSARQFKLLPPSTTAVTNHGHAGP